MLYVMDKVQQFRLQSVLNVYGKDIEYLVANTSNTSLLGSLYRSYEDIQDFFLLACDILDSP